VATTSREGAKPASLDPLATRAVVRAILVLCDLPGRHMTMEALARSMAVSRENYAKIAHVLPLSLKRAEDGIAAKVRKSKASPLEKLALLYRCMDDIYAVVAKYVPCRAGCCHCCHYNVTISEVETAYVEKHVGITREAFLGARFDRHGLPCPFLKDCRCAIYEYRPYVCRRFVTLAEGPYWCRVEVCNDAKLVLLGFTKLNEAYEWIVGPGGLAGLVDIREVFPFGRPPTIARRSGVE